MYFHSQGEHWIARGKFEKTMYDKDFQIFEKYKFQKSQV